MTGRASRRKGHDFERWLARHLTTITGRVWRRGFQARDGGTEQADVYSEGLPFHIECKKGKRPPLKAALLQAERDCGTDPATKPIAVVCSDREDPIVLMRLKEFEDLLSDHLNWMESRQPID